MARSRTFSVMAILCIVGRAVMVASTSADEDAFSPGPSPSPSPSPPSSSSSDTDIPEIQHEHKIFLEDCEKELPPECSDQLFTGILSNIGVTTACCREVGLMGKECYDGFIDLILQFPEFKANALEITSSGAQLWDNCDLAVKADSSACYTYSD